MDVGGPRKELTADELRQRNETQRQDDFRALMGIKPVENMEYADRCEDDSAQAAARDLKFENLNAVAKQLDERERELGRHLHDQLFSLAIDVGNILHPKKLNMQDLTRAVSKLRSVTAMLAKPEGKKALQVALARSELRPIDRSRVQLEQLGEVGKKMSRLAETMEHKGEQRTAREIVEQIEWVLKYAADRSLLG